MTTPAHSLLFVDDERFDVNSLAQLVQLTVQQFKQVTRQYALFHIGFYSLAFLELIAFVLFFSFFTQTSLFAFSIAGLCLTGFTYFVLLFYLQAKKPQELLDILAQFTQASSQFSVVDGHVGVTRIHALNQLFTALHEQEYTYYTSASSRTLSPLIQKFSAWIHWKDLHRMNEMILNQMMQEHFIMIKDYPTDRDIHASLAQIYLWLSELYTDPADLSLENAPLWTSPEYGSTAFAAQKRQALMKALEEYKILDFYSPQDRSIYQQLARIYYDLQEPDKAIAAYEVIVGQHPDDVDALFDLGTLYFEHGRYAQGLQIYEQLKKNGNPRSETLLSYYTKHDSRIGLNPISS